MCIAFDKTAPGEGVETFLRLEAGKACFEWQFHYTEQPRKETVHIRLRDSRQETVLECVGSAAEEDPLQGILLQPRLWEGVRNPYLYTLEAVLSDSRGVCLDRSRRTIPLRSVELRGERLLLNGEHFELKAVRWENTKMTNMSFPSEPEWRDRMEEDLQKLLVLGANSILTNQEKGLTKPFLQLRERCDEMGILLLTDVSCSAGDKICGSRKELRNIPLLRGGENPLLKADGQPASEFYRYRARWSAEPFVYLVPESVKRQRDGSFCATVYSSCHRIALYSDGALFEFQSGQEEFTFREIPAKGPCVILSAEGDGCSAAFSVHKTFTKLSPNGDN